MKKTISNTGGALFVLGLLVVVPFVALASGGGLGSSGGSSVSDSGVQPVGNIGRTSYPAGSLVYRGVVASSDGRATVPATGVVLAASTDAPAGSELGAAVVTTSALTQSWWLWLLLLVLLAVAGYSYWRYGQDTRQIR